MQAIGKGTIGANGALTIPFDRLVWVAEREQ